jgi:DNA-binding Lrp family transcriptional regulator
MAQQEPIDATDARVLRALINDPRISIMAMAASIGVSRNTVHARLGRFEERGVLNSVEQQINLAALGYPLTAFMNVIVRQRMFDEVAASLAQLPEVLVVFGLTGSTDLLARVAARDAEDLYRVAGMVIDIAGVERAETALVMRRLVDYRISPLLDRIIGD